MNDLLKYGLLAAGAYLLYVNFVPQSAPPSVEAPNGGTPAGESTVPTTPSSVNIRSMILANAALNGERNNLAYDGWNYYYQRVRGTYGPDWEKVTENLPVGDPRTNRSFLMTVDDFLTLTTPLGLAGLGGYNVANAWESATKRLM